MDRHSLPARIAILWCVLALTPAVAADDPNLIAGNFVIVADQKADVDNAIETTIAKMNFIKRPIARSRLKDTNPVYRHIRIVNEGAETEVAFDDRKPIRMPVNAAPKQWTREDGKVFDVAITRQGGRLSQSYQSKDGERSNTFRWDSGTSRLYLDVTMSSEQLPQPLQYTLVYRSE